MNCRLNTASGRYRSRFCNMHFFRNAWAYLLGQLANCTTTEYVCPVYDLPFTIYYHRFRS